LVWEMKTVVGKPETIFWLTRKMVPAERKIFSYAKTMVSGIEIMFCMVHIIFTTTGTMVAATEKDVVRAGLGLNCPLKLQIFSKEMRR